MRIDSLRDTIQVVIAMYPDDPRVELLRRIVDPEVDPSFFPDYSKWPGLVRDEVLDYIIRTGDIGVTERILVPSDCDPLVAEMAASLIGWL